AGSPVGPTDPSHDKDHEESDDTPQSPTAPSEEGERLEFMITDSADRHGVGYHSTPPRVGPRDTVPSRSSISLQDFVHVQQRAS
ncbi:hypothetical protein SARC_05298, partial [Sphaeroforma arctica JP610]